MPILFLCLVFCFTSLSGQEDKELNESRHKIGFVTGYGDQGLGKFLNFAVNYRYEVHFYQLQYYYSILNKPKWNLELLAQPQFNTTKLASLDDLPGDVSGYEFGLNLGVLVRRNLFNDIMSVYSGISVGPHYISKTPLRQAKGFNFSDNILAGVNVRIAKTTYLDLRCGFRHMSNGGFNRPNGGINNIVLSAGVMIVLN